MSRLESRRGLILIIIIIIISRYNAARLGQHLSELVPIITGYAINADEDDELREICLQALESFVLRCPTEIGPFVDQISNLALEYIKYDPNIAEDDDEVCINMSSVIYHQAH